MDENRFTHSLVVLGIPRTAMLEDVRPEFEKFGAISRVDWVPVKGCAFVWFEQAEHCDDAVAGSQGLVIQGENTKVLKQTKMEKQQRQDREPRTSVAPVIKAENRMRVDPIPSGARWTDLKDWAKEAGDITYTNIVKDDGGEYGIVEFRNKEDALSAVATMDGKDFMGMSVAITKDTTDYTNRLSNGEGKNFRDKFDNRDNNGRNGANNRNDNDRFDDRRGDRGGEYRNDRGPDRDRAFDDYRDRDERDNNRDRDNRDNRDHRDNRDRGDFRDDRGFAPPPPAYNVNDGNREAEILAQILSLERELSSIKEGRQQQNQQQNQRQQDYRDYPQRDPPRDNNVHVPPPRNDYNNEPPRDGRDMIMDRRGGDGDRSGGGYGDRKEGQRDSQTMAIERRTKPCFNFINGGKCARGDACHYSHDPAVIAESRNQDSRNQSYGGGRGGRGGRGGGRGDRDSRGPPRDRSRSRDRSHSPDRPPRSPGPRGEEM